ncbi:MAG: phosphoribosyltransferase [Acetobacteraceae bacterium]|nr:phosphoribosyltransferase [Acetobacteraceae bacterium]
MAELNPPESGPVLWLSWQDVMDICKRLALAIDREYDPEIIVGIARAGVIPAAIISCMLRKEFYPIRLSRRWRDRLVRSRPQVLVPMTDDVSGKTVLIVDEMSATGETLRLAMKEAAKKGARRVKSAALYVRPGTWKPHWYGLETDALVVQPWDAEVLLQGRFVLHPEYREATERINRW